MKKILLVFFAWLIIGNTGAQPWLRNMPPAAVSYKEQAPQNINAIRDAFYDYWKDKEVSEREEENAEEGGFQQFERWYYMMRSRTYPSGNLFDTDILYKEFDKLKARAAVNKITAGSWTYIGQDMVPVSGGGVGRINVIQVDPNNSSILYIGAACGGLWKSTDGGLNWSTTTDLLPSISIADIAINPQNSNIIYIATGDGYGYETGTDFWGGLYSGGVFKSTDGGNTWSPTSLSYVQTNKQVIQRLLINPQNPDVLIACSRNYLYRSADAGASWARVATNHFYDLEFKPGNPDIVFAAASNKVYKSVDGGLTFTAGATTLGSGRLSISVTPANPDAIYALSENGATLWKSSDEGVSFVQKTSPSTLSTFYGYYDNVLSVSPVDENYLVCGGLDLVKSTNGGTSWSLAANSGSGTYVHVDQKGYEFQQGSSQVMYAVNDGGVFKTTNGGTTWTDIGAHIHIKQYYKMSSCLANPILMYAGAQDNGTDYYNGFTWRHVYGGDGMDCAADPVNANTAYVSSQYGNFARTTNGGTNFTNITPSGQSGDWVTPIAIDPVTPSTIYIGYQSLYKSLNNGTTWTVANSNTLGGGNFTIIRIAPSNTNYIYAGNLGNIKRSTDGGFTFSSIASGLPIGGVGLMDIAISDTDPNVIWAVFSGYQADKKVYSSVDGGATWTNVSGTALPNVPVNCVVYQPGSNDMVYVGTDISLFYKDNSMADWMPFNTDLPNVIIADLEIIPSIGKIRAATYGRGIWQSDLAPSALNILDAGVVSFSPALALVCSQPFSPSVIIRNYGTSALTDLTISYSVDGGPVQSFQWTGNLAFQASANVNIPSLSVPDGLHTITVSVSNPNGQADQNSVNDVITSGFRVHSAVNPAPVTEDFESPGSPIKFRFEDSVNMLSVTNTAGGFGNSASSMKVNFYETVSGSADLISYPVDLSAVNPPAKLTFDLAYIRYTPTVRDSMFVLISTDCGSTWNQIYMQTGVGLATVPGYQSIPFIPTAGQWRNDVVSLAAYSSATNAIFRFMFKSGYGNILYVDNINLDGTVGVNEIHAGQFAVFPNPASNELFVRFAELPRPGIQLRLYDVTGRLIRSFEARDVIVNGNQWALNIKDINEGIYYLKAEGIAGSFLSTVPVLITH